ncbi:MAG TPA: hypothetical protein VLB01_04295 [Thermodesulfobacteriota bacterium]|nr:hypothetical protein [Thermodesulfobacteriota bacterium]
METEDFERIVEMWRNYMLVDALEGYQLEIDEDVPKEFAAIALYLDYATVRKAGDVEDYYQGYRQAAVDVLNLIGVEMTQDDIMKVILIKRKIGEEVKQERLKQHIWG